MEKEERRELGRLAGLERGRGPGFMSNLEAGGTWCGNAFARGAVVRSCLPSRGAFRESSRVRPSVAQ